MNCPLCKKKMKDRGSFLYECIDFHCGIASVDVATIRAIRKALNEREATGYNKGFTRAMEDWPMIGRKPEEAHE